MWGQLESSFLLDRFHLRWGCRDVLYDKTADGETYVTVLAMSKGALVLKDFDIRKEAGASLQPLLKEYKAHVSENYLEIHLFWAGKGTCCVPIPGTYGLAILVITATQDFIPIGFAVGGGVLLLLISVFLIVRRRKGPNSCDDEGNMQEMCSRSSF